MRRPMIWRLMAAYSRNGSRLSHALAALKVRLYGLPPVRAYAYLLRMAGRGLDFATLARAREVEDIERQSARACSDEETSILAQLRRAGARFEIVATAKVWTSDGAFATAPGASSVLPINGRLAEAVREGRVVVL
jgi:hypothetical protein